MSLLCAGASTDTEESIKEKLQEKINSNAKVYFIISVAKAQCTSVCLYVRHCTINNWWLRH